MGNSFLRATIHYAGRVQGVGFRYTVYQLAKGYEAAGYVKNLPDGRVELVAEGAESEVRGFLDDIANKMVGYIRSAERHDEGGEPMHSGFGIR